MILPRLALLLGVLLGCGPSGEMPTVRLIDARTLPGNLLLVSERWQDRRRVVLWEESTDARETVFEAETSPQSTGGDLHLRDHLVRSGAVKVLLARQEGRDGKGARRPGRLGILTLGQEQVEWIDSRVDLDPLDRDLVGSPRLVEEGLLYPVEDGYFVRLADGTLERREEVDLPALPVEAVQVDPTGRRLLRDGRELAYEPRRP